MPALPVFGDSATVVDVAVPRCPMVGGWEAFISEAFVDTPEETTIQSAAVGYESIFVHFFGPWPVIGRCVNPNSS